MGEIAAGLAQRQHAARAQFAGLFAEFASPAGQARISALAGLPVLTGGTGPSRVTGGKAARS
jgi:hypothetical protein